MNLETIKKFFTTLLMAVLSLLATAVLLFGCYVAYQRFAPDLLKGRGVETAKPEVAPVAVMKLEAPESGDVHSNLQEGEPVAAEKKAADDVSADTPSAGLRLCVIDFDRLMKDSRPGKIISQYVTDYKKVMDDSIAKLNASAQAAQRGGNWGLYASLQDDKRYLQGRKTRVEESAKEYMQAIVKASLSQAQIADNAVIIDSAVAYNTVPAQDATAELITRLENVVPQMPELPKITIKGAPGAASRQAQVQPQAAPAPAAAQKKPAPSRQGSRSRRK